MEAEIQIMVEAEIMEGAGFQDQITKNMAIIHLILIIV
jgi:hypothetical protein